MSRGVAAGDFDNLENSLDSCFQKAGFQMRFLHLGWGGGSAVVCSSSSRFQSYPYYTRGGPSLLHPWASLLTQMKLPPPSA